MRKTDGYIQMLALSDPLREPTIRSAIRALQLPSGSCGLDAGCGIGSHTPLLAEAVGPDGHVVGLDRTPEFLHHARRIAEESGLGGQISYQRGNVNSLPFPDDAFDWLWSVDCVGYPAREPLPLLKEVVRVVRPGGEVAILFWSSQRLLPGHPLLEARLDATSAGIAPFTVDMRPDFHHLCALGWLRHVGLERTRVRTFVGDAHAPLDEKIRNALAALLDMRWEESARELAKEDLVEYMRLCRPDSRDYILNDPNYYAFFTYSMFHGMVP